MRDKCLYPGENSDQRHIFRGGFCIFCGEITDEKRNHEALQEYAEKARLDHAEEIEEQQGEQYQ